jgi:hypothetical protein
MMSHIVAGAGFWILGGWLGFDATILHKQVSMIPFAWLDLHYSTISALELTFITNSYSLSAVPAV